MFKYIVPATSANLGIGFDCLGIALNIYDYFIVEESDKFDLSGFIDNNPDNNLFIKAYIKACKLKNKDIIPLKVNLKANVPISRGLGSSSCMIVGGIYAFNLIHNNILSKKEMLEIATNIEGHPDNVAPCIYGGLCVSGNNETLKLKVSSKWHFGVWIPPYEISTSAARKVLPDNYSREEAVSNIASAIKGIKALETFDLENIKYLCNDKIHEPYRKSLIKDFKKYENLAYQNGAKAFLISGSGSTCLSISDKDLNIDSNINYKNIKVDNKGVRCLKST